MPAVFVERVATFTAVQWDGSEDSAAWIVANVEGASQDGDQMIVRDSMDREEPIEAQFWVVKNDTTGDVVTIDPDTFAARYQQTGM